MQFTSEFHTTLNAEQMAFCALEAHWQSNPVKWKFWKRPPAEWKQREAQLMEEYKQACLTMNGLKDAQTPGRANARHKAMKIGGIFAMIFFAGGIGLAANHFINDGQVNWVTAISMVTTGVGAVGAFMCAFILGE